MNRLFLKSLIDLKAIHEDNGNTMYIDIGKSKVDVSIYSQDRIVGEILYTKTVDENDTEESIDKVLVEILALAQEVAFF